MDDHKPQAELGKRLRAARRVVIKLGTTTVTGPEGELCAERVQPIVNAVTNLMQEGRQIIMVSSGAVGLGRGWLGLHRSRLEDMVTKQACAAVGQSLLMETYKQMFGAFNIKVAQVLLTEDDFTNWRRYSNLQHTIEKLLGFGVLPIINENDTVSTAELESVNTGTRTPAFGDNDRLAALVMSGMEADALVLLTNVDGLLRIREDGTIKQKIPVVEEITPELRSLAAGPSESGRGGMYTKMQAAEIAMNCGGTAVIANGSKPDTLLRIFAGKPEGTVFLPSRRMRGKRRWIAYAADVRGRVAVDEGAHRAITQGKASLLASGILRVESQFAPLDVVSIVDSGGREFARGIADCASEDAERFARQKNAHPGARAGAPLVLVKRDNIVLLQKS